MRVAVIYHCPQTSGRLDDALSDVDARVDRHHLDKGDAVPAGLAAYDRVVSLGGPMGAYDSDRFWWMEEEKAWLAGLVEREIPVLGICLGAQLLADALGGEAYKAEAAEAAVLSLQLTEEGRRHPVVSLAQPSVFSLHQDTFHLPKGAALLAHSERFPHAFQYGSALALQFHPDADLDLALSWGREESSILGAGGIEFDEYAAQLKSADNDLDRSSREIFRAWLQ